MQKINLREKLSLFSSHWDPKIVGVHVLLFEPATTLNTSDAVSERTAVAPERI